MNPVLGLAAVIAGGLALVLGWLLLYEQQQAFGLLSGNLLAALEVGVCVVLFRGARLVPLERRKRYLGDSLVLLSCCLLVIGWLVRPKQVVDRAWDRVNRLESAIAEITRSYPSVPGLPEPPDLNPPVLSRDEVKRLERLRVDLSAARLEREAAEIRRTKGDPEYFQSNFVSTVLMSVGAVAGVASVYLGRRRPVA